MTNPGNVFPIGGRETTTLLHSDDRSLAWKSVRVPDGIEDILGVFGTAAGRVYAVGRGGGGGVILESSDRGGTWSSTLSVADTVFTGVWGAADRVYVVGADSTNKGLLYRTE